MPHSKQKDTTFWGHLEVFRWVIIRCLAVTAGVAIFAFCFKETLFDNIVLAPLRQDFVTYRMLCRLGETTGLSSLCPQIDRINLININLASQFFIHMEIAGVAALVVAFPYLTTELWMFVKPALYSHERHTAVHGATAFVGLFFVGVATAYFVIFPLTVNFLGNYQVSTTVANQISLNSYISTLLTLTFMMGVVFEMPIVAYFFAKIGMLKSDFLKRYRKVALVVIMVLAAIITPSTDAFTMMLVVLPLGLLYEVSRSVVKRVETAEAVAQAA